MEIDLGPKAKAFRDELRQWLEANQPPPTEGATDSLAEEEAVRRGRMGPMGPRWTYWSEKLAEGGYLCVAWP
jgi:hypothetical protein